MKQVYIIVLNTRHGQAEFYDTSDDTFSPNRRDATEFLFLDNAQEISLRIRKEESFKDDYITIRMEYV